MRNATLLQQVVLVVTILWYGFFAFSPFVQHTLPVAGAMSSMGHGVEMQQHGHDMSDVDCATAACVTAMDVDCLSHCLQQALQVQPSIVAITIVTAFFAVLIGILTVQFGASLVVDRPPDSWYQPFFQFATVRLLE